MSRSKENHSQLSHQDYIRYLYQEGVRKGIHKKSNFYSELIKFVNSSQGQEGFNKFINLYYFPMQIEQGKLMRHGHHGTG